MIYSMTGYGRAEKEIDGKKVIVEINSLNNRYCEIQIRMPRTFSQYEHDLKELVSSSVSRGKVFVNIGIEEDPELAAQRLELNCDTAQMYYKVFKSLQDKLELPGEIQIKNFIGLPDLIKPVEDNVDEEEIVKLIKDSLGQALIDFLNMRSKEGGKLMDDIILHIDKIEVAIGEIEANSEKNIKAYYQKLEARIKELTDNVSISEDTLATEAAIMAERSDITEECVRIRSHLELFRDAYNSENAVGKKMNFILQELYRETNTIGSKSISSDISMHVIGMKEEIEKVREQVQNIE